MPEKSPDSSPFWAKEAYASRRPILLARTRIVAELRAWFAEQGFVEVETGALQVSPGNETHLHAFATALTAPDGTAAKLYLRTSPEFTCKKLLAAGEPRIVEFAKVFRNRERGALHHPEFTMIEWYRAGEPYSTLMTDCAALVRSAAEIGGTREFNFRGRACDPFAVPDRLTVAEAFTRFAGIDLLATLPDGKPDRSALARAAQASGVRIADDDHWGDIFSKILVERVEPNLGIGRATILDEYPAVLSALARPARDPRVAERFELYMCGVELANGFGELIDPAAQRSRLEHEMAEKARIYGDRYPIDEDFIAALAHMPQASGVALGLDRLVMLATGATRIDQVLWAPMKETFG
ncbi:MAG TPA: EF-P lysine aminoacylase EpmA [Xanthobacteraceae bacterium]|nr:EF-P lysine aminoacylase EpmA [Xanthobacteraceae bacterium]